MTEISAQSFKTARMALGVNQGQFAQLIDRRRETVSQQENGNEPVTRAYYELALAWAEAPAAFERRMREVGLLDEAGGA